MKKLYKRLRNIRHKRILAGVLSAVVLMQALFVNTVIKSVHAKDVQGGLQAGMNTGQAEEEKYRILATATEHGSVTISGNAVDVTGEAVLAATGEACAVVFTPDAGYNVTQIQVNGVDCLSQAAVVDSDLGSYGLVYEYTKLRESGTDVTSYSLEAEYGWKETELNAIVVDALNDTMYLGASYACTADAVIYNKDEELEWSCVQSDGSVYPGALMQADALDSTKARVSLTDDAGDGDEFFVKVKPTDSASDVRKKIMVSIPKVEEGQYGYFGADGTALVAKDSWYDEAVVLKAAGAEYTKLEIYGQAELVDGYTIVSSVTDGSLQIRLVQTDHDRVMKKSAWFYPSVQIDSQKPTIVSVDNPSEKSWVSNGHAITVLAHDQGGSGIAYMEYKAGGGQAQRIEPVSTVGGNVVFTFDTLRDDEGNDCSDINQYDIVVYDRAGNVSQATQAAVHVDMAPPRIAKITFSSTEEHPGRLDLPFGHFSKNKVVVEADVEKDAQLSKVTEVYLTYDTVLGEKVVLTAPAVNAKAVFELDAPSMPMEYRNIRIKAADEAGHMSAEVRYTDLHATWKPEDGADNLLIEDAPPVIRFELEQAVGAGKYIDASTKDVWFQFDDGQPISVPFSIDDGQDGSGIYRYTRIMNGNTLGASISSNDKRITAINDRILLNSRNTAGQIILPQDKYKYELQVEAYDNAGNRSLSSCSVYVDGDAPVIERLNTTSAGWTNADSVTITGTVKDGGSGIGRIVYGDINDVSMAVGEAKFVDGNSSFSFEVSGEQEKTYYVWAIDHVGNISEPKAMEVKIDHTPPQIKEVSLDGVESKLTFGNFSNQDVTLHIQVGDGTVSSGIKAVNVYDGQDKIAEAIRTDIENVSYSCVISDVKHYRDLYIEVVDQVGHRHRAALSEIKNNDGIASNGLMVEQTAPEVMLGVSDRTVQVDGKDWVGGDTQFIVQVSDIVGDSLVSGIRTVKGTLNGTTVLDEAYQLEMLPKTDLIVATTAQGVAVSGEGAYTLEVHVCDNAGNTFTESKTIYIDREQPQIDSVRLLKNAGGQQDEFDSDNYREFGNFYNGDARLEISFSDKAPACGVNPEQVRMYDRDGDGRVLNEYKPVSVSGNIALFDIACPSTQNLSVEVKDYVGHTVGSTAISKVSGTDSIESDQVMLEKGLPDVSLDVIEKEAGTQEYENKNSGGLWFDRDVTFVMQVSEPDDESAIRSMEANINDNIPALLYSKENKALLHGKSYRLNTSSVSVNNDDGAYELTCTAIDNAGNIRTGDRKIYIDRTNPQVTGYQFEAAGQDRGSTSVTPVVLTDYGYYFKEDTNIKVSAVDQGASAGLKELRYRFVSVDSQESTGVIPFVADEKSAEVTIPVKAGFKGRIFTELVDHVNRTSGEQTCDGIIYETPNLHSQTSAIDFTRSTSEKKDGSGLDLFHAGVPLTLHVEDTYSGIAKIEWQVVSDGDVQNNQSGEIEVYNNGTWSDPSWRALAGEHNLRTVMEKDIVVGSNSNNIRVSVTLTDRAGNVSYKEDAFSIDMTAPMIRVSYSNNDADVQNQDYFKEGRTATVSILERNFDPANVRFDIANSDGVMPAISDWTVSYGSGNGDENTYATTITYAADGDYTFDVQYTDEAGNTAYGVDYGSSVSPTEFTVDMTLPEVDLAYDSSSQNSYYNAPREGTITVREHNFDASRVETTIVETNSLGQDSSNPPAVGEWQDIGGDTYQAKVLFARDARYSISIQYQDMAGNQAQAIEEQQFVIDNTDPVIKIAEVEDRHAYNQETIAPIVQFQDVNIEQTSITLKGAKNGDIELKGQEAFSQVGSIENDTKTFTFDNLAADDIYTLSASATDKAGRSAQLTYRFSVNRNGSTYEITEETQEKMNNKYTNAPIDVVIHEINVDPLAQDSIVVTLTKDNESRELDAQEDYTLTKEGNDGEWSIYTYTVPAKQFEKDGYYMVRLHSQDGASNISQNDLEDKKAEIAFHVDKTAPNLRFLDLEDGETYPVDSKQALIAVNDNTYVKEVEILLNGEIEKTYKEDEIQELEDGNEKYQVTIGNSNDTQSVQVVALDAAGNRTQVEVKDFYVTTNAWIRFLNNRVALYGTIAGAALVVAGGVAVLFIVKRRRSRG